MQKKMRQAEERLARNTIGVNTQQSINSGQNTRATSLLASSHQNGGSFCTASNNYSKGGGVSIYQRNNREMDRCGTGNLDRKDNSSQIKQSGSSNNLNMRSSFNHLPS